MIPVVDLDKADSQLNPERSDHPVPDELYDARIFFITTTIAVRQVLLFCGR